jgi:Ran-binding protein 3
MTTELQTQQVGEKRPREDEDDDHCDDLDRDRDDEQKKKQTTTTTVEVVNNNNNKDCFEAEAEEENLNEQNNKMKATATATGEQTEEEEEEEENVIPPKATATATKSFGSGFGSGFGKSFGGFSGGFGGLSKVTSASGFGGLVQGAQGGEGANDDNNKKDDNTNNNNNLNDDNTISKDVPVFGAVFGQSKDKQQRQQQQLNEKGGNDDDDDRNEDDENEEQGEPSNNNNKEFKPIAELREVDQQTGEEGEDLIYKTDGALYEYVNVEEDGKAPGWRERGRGEFRLNSTKNKDNARMIMRSKGNFRLILNASMFKGQKFTKMEGGKGVTFPCINAATNNKMTTYALKMRVAGTSAAQQVDTFLEQASIAQRMIK